MSEMKEKFLELPIFSTGGKMKVAVNKIIDKTKSSFQDILIADSKEFGKCLIIDGVMQCAESDHETYDFELLKLLKKSDKKILVLGGGDGYVAEMILKLNPKAIVKIVDLDIEVVQSCQKKLGQKIFKDPRVRLYVGDAFHYLKFFNNRVNGKFDGIVCDLTDSPIGRRNKKDFSRFYREIITLSKGVLKKSGWMSIQAGASKTNKYYINAIEILGKIMKDNFSNVKKTDIYIPSYGESCAFLFGKK
jgi:spermidine synthase